ncbi:peptide-methionine (S)-S-oxide reductase MsrA [Roseiconus nitratireducens]|uniref:Peptide methionine sulfoxide reductase MsrA n=1 Tax=Roseiconus nitratireducens TaxID=2605748 RepID=A0A5M6CU55_9BACT|nr:peptide-methionine (S)-S-oxide reductase MsrA [Roseiconus nitratireducens]KAA5538506.1 peptide-methionine (S)-S-oxide reductase MsrA [Roseiconus nitratireducens]
MCTLTRLRLAATVVGTLCALSGNAIAEDSPNEIATFGGGCYWCVEAVFQRIEGVESVAPGFMGGRTSNPTYQQVMTGRTGHVEVVKIEFDPSVVSYETLLQVFFRTHDPTTRNRQGPDVGTRYRSVIFCHTDEQKSTANEYKRLLMRQKTFRSPIVTSIEDAETFYPTDADHSNFFNRNKQSPYCVANIVPKLEKLQKEFGDQLKSEENQ